MTRARRLGFAAAVFVAWLCAPARPATACTCAVRDLADQVQTASTVFVGTVATADEASVTFEVDRVYKGNSPDATPISNGGGAGSTCAIPFEEDRRYVVFAALENGTLSTGLCSGTTDDLSVADRLSVNAGPAGSPHASPTVVRVIVVSRRTVPIAAAGALATSVAAVILLARRALGRPRPIA
jgi:hypothetical protein